MCNGSFNNWGKKTHIFEYFTAALPFRFLKALSWLKIKPSRARMQILRILYQINRHLQFRRYDECSLATPTFSLMFHSRLLTDDCKHLFPKSCLDLFHTEQSWHMADTSTTHDQVNPKVYLNAYPSFCCHPLRRRSSYLQRLISANCQMMAFLLYSDILTIRSGYPENE